MKFECLCGTLIPDQTDALPHKARVVSDQDWSDLVETIDAVTARAGVCSEENSMAIISAFLGSARIAYQCRNCGRIWLNDNAGMLHSFAPDSCEAPHDLFRRK